MSNTWISTLDVIGSHEAVAEFISATMQAAQNDHTPTHEMNAWTQCLVDGSTEPLDEALTEKLADGLETIGLWFGVEDTSLWNEVSAESGNYPNLLFVATTQDPNMHTAEARTYLMERELSSASMEGSAYKELLNDDECPNNEEMEVIADRLAKEVTEPALAIFSSGRCHRIKRS